MVEALDSLPGAQALSWQACRLWGVSVRVHGEPPELARLGC